MASKKSRKPATRSRQTTRAQRRPAAVGRHEQSYRPNPDDATTAFDALTPLEHYRREKERRAAERAGPASDPLEEARREYRAMLAADAARQKGGRPKKGATRPSAAPAVDASDENGEDAEAPEAPLADDEADEADEADGDT